MSAGIKFLILLLLSGSLLFGIVPMAAVSVLLLAVSFSAGVKPRELFAGSRPIAIMLLFVLLFRSFSLGFPIIHPVFDLGGFKEVLIFSWGIMLTFAAGALYFSVTTTHELKNSLSKAELFLLRPFKVTQPRFSLCLSLMLMFIPRFFELWENANLSYTARSGKKGIRRLMTTIPLVTEKMIIAAAETAEALEARGLFL
jgi:biotin transport system permease protein